MSAEEKNQKDDAAFHHTIRLFGNWADEVRRTLAGKEVEKIAEIAIEEDMGETCVTLAAPSPTEARQALQALRETLAENQLSSYIYGVDCTDVESVMVPLLRTQNLTIATAESCTGGYIGKRITNVPGASSVYPGGVVTYCDAMKHKLLKVRKDTLSVHTAVSQEVAAQMAKGVRALLQTDIALSVTGYAGPGGGTTENPCGTVYIGISDREGERVVRLSFSPGRTREYIRYAAASAAMFLAMKGNVKIDETAN